jgi:hypothetical protein
MSQYKVAPVMAAKRVWCLTDFGDRLGVGQPILAAAVFQAASSGRNAPPETFPAIGWRGADRERHFIREYLSTTKKAA